MRTKPIRLIGWLLLGWAWWPAGGLAFVHAQVGDVIKNREMRTLEGETLPFLGDAKVNVFIFFRPGQDHSERLLRHLSDCQKEMAGKSVRWVAIVSDRFSRNEIRYALTNNRVEMPILLDQGDALYGGLGVRLHPVVGITDREHRLVAYQPFKKLNYAEMIRAQIRRLLGEISAEDLDAALAPVRAEKDRDAALAARRHHLAAKLFQKGQYDKALVLVRGSLKLKPDRAESHFLLGKIHAAQGDHAQAIQALEKVLELYPQHEEALKALKVSKELAP